MSANLSIYLLVIAAVLVVIAVYGNTIAKGIVALWVTAP